ncbi:hypothetical protein NL108_016515 [Boleophthalmus pectinirostris]|nr:hypothetical protein NL108_016515 [Boleophthalmus pectinirostris]
MTLNCSIAVYTEEGELSTQDALWLASLFLLQWLCLVLIAFAVWNRKRPKLENALIIFVVLVPVGQAVSKLLCANTPCQPSLFILTSSLQALRVHKMGKMWYVLGWGGYVAYEGTETLFIMCKVQEGVKIGLYGVYAIAVASLVVSACISLQNFPYKRTFVARMIVEWLVLAVASYWCHYNEAPSVLATLTYQYYVLGRVYAARDGYVLAQSRIRPSSVIARRRQLNKTEGK